MPYLIFTIYDMNHGENLLPRVYRIPKFYNLTHGNNLYHNFIYQQIRRELEKELLEDYNEVTNIEDLFMIDEYIIDKISMY